MKIEDFVGNDDLKSQIKAMFANERIPHAIILEGKAGTGKKTFAGIIANFAVCNRVKGTPCYECNSCEKALRGTHPDIIFPEKTGILNVANVSEVRRIKKDAYVVPNEAPKKVYIFTDVDEMGIQAQNSLLKVLEEPPKNVIFIFTCENLGNILPTVRSRLQAFRLNAVNKDEAINFLLNTQKEHDVDSIKEAVRLSCGNIGRAIEFLREDKIRSTIVLVDKVVSSIANLNNFDIMINLGKVLEEKKEVKNILNLLYLKVMDALRLCAGGNVECEDEASFMMYKKLGIDKIEKALHILDESIRLCNQNVNKDLIVTYICGELQKFVCN